MLLSKSERFFAYAAPLLSIPFSHFKTHLKMKKGFVNSELKCMNLQVI